MVRLQAVSAAIVKPGDGGGSSGEVFVRQPICRFDLGQQAGGTASAARYELIKSQPTTCHKKRRRKRSGIRGRNNT